MVEGARVQTDDVEAQVQVQVGLRLNVCAYSFSREGRLFERERDLLVLGHQQFVCSYVVGGWLDSLFKGRGLKKK